MYTKQGKMQKQVFATNVWLLNILRLLTAPRDVPLLEVATLYAILAKEANTPKMKKH